MLLCWTELNETVLAVSGKSGMDIDSPLSSNWISVF